MPTPEAKVKQKIKKVLDRYERNIYYFMPVQMGLGAVTIDYLGCVKGKFFGIEAKKPGGRTTKLQDLVLARIRNAGGSTFIIFDNDGLEDLEIFLDGIVNPTVTHIRGHVNGR